MVGLYHINYTNLIISRVRCRSAAKEEGSALLEHERDPLRSKQHQVKVDMLRSVFVSDDPGGGLLDNSWGHTGEDAREILVTAPGATEDEQFSPSRFCGSNALL